MNKSTGLRSDQTIVLAGYKASKYYPEPLRRITYYDTETSKRFVFLTNNFTLCALTIAQTDRRHLVLDGTKITDEGLTHLTRLQNNLYRESLIHRRGHRNFSLS